MKHETLEPFVAIDIIYEFFVGDSAEGGNREGLGFPSGKQSGTVGPLQNFNFTCYRPDIFETSSICSSFFS